MNLVEKKRKENFLMQQAKDVRTDLKSKKS